ncbi:hypothetical protein D3C81_1130130 [compost metagenome]
MQLLLLQVGCEPAREYVFHILRGAFRQPGNWGIAETRPTETLSSILAFIEFSVSGTDCEIDQTSPGRDPLGEHAVVNHHVTKFCAGAAFTWRLDLVVLFSANQRWRSAVDGNVSR